MSAFAKMTVTQLKEALAAKSIAFEKSAKKADLVALLEGNAAEAPKKEKKTKAASKKRGKEEEEPEPEPEVNFSFLFSLFFSKRSRRRKRTKRRCF